jgi:dTMP kinase
MGRGPLIVIEGQNRMNKSHLASIIAKGLEHITETRNNVFKLPHRTGWADCMTNQYLEGTLDLDVKVAHHLFSAERWKTVHDVKILLNMSQPVILQRYVASGHVYSLARGGVDSDWCKQFDKGLIKQDLVVYMQKDDGDDPEDLWFEPEKFETSEFQENVRFFYQQFKETESNWMTLNVTGSTPRSISNQVLPVVRDLMHEHIRDDKEFQYY